MALKTPCMARAPVHTLQATASVFKAHKDGNDNKPMWCVETSDLREGKKKGRHLLASFLLSPPVLRPRLPRRISARASSPRVRACGTGFSGDGYMATGGDKCGDPAAAAAGEGGSDLYAVLGLKKECSDADLKFAYRKLAMRWHPDRCSSSSTAKHMEEVKEKFQEIQGAYSVLSDANKRFLYDVGVYDDDEDDDSLQGMGDFIGEMAQMMSQSPPTRQESFEELQQLFVDMFQADLDSGFCNGPAKGHHAQAQSQTRTSSTSPWSSPSPPPPLATKAEAPSCNGINKRGSSAMDLGKPPTSGEVGAGQSRSGFCFGESDTKQAPKMRGGSTNRRRDGRKQKLSSKHDVSSEDEISNSHQRRAA